MPRTTTHWGTYDVEIADGRVSAVKPLASDPDPSPIADSLLDGPVHPIRIARPAVRQGFLDGTSRGPTEARGTEPFVELSWDEVLDLVADELDRVRTEHGNASIFGGSYGWGSAGLFHRPNAHLQRFLGLIGGYTSTKLTYSLGAGAAIAPYVIGEQTFALWSAMTPWETLAEHCDLMVCLGGLPLKNTQVDFGGTGPHRTSHDLRACVDAGMRLVNVSPIGADIDSSYDAEWIPIRPNTDTAFLLGLAHTLIKGGLHDRSFLDRYCVGFDRFEAYVTGQTDGVAKSAEWASGITGVPAGRIEQLATEMTSCRSLINANWALQRAQHGEQPWWMTIVLAAMIGQIGLPGGGFGLAYGSTSRVGNNASPFSMPMVPPTANAVDVAVPVSRITDVLTQPGRTVPFLGGYVTYPDIRLVYWAGGNPFHHHQDLNRFVHAWGRPETIVVNEQFWTATAKHADIVLPATTALERNDLAGVTRTGIIYAMGQAMPAYQGARNDYAILADVARRLQVEQDFTLGLDEEGWLRELWAQAMANGQRFNITLPSFDEFWAMGEFELPAPRDPQLFMADFRSDPEGNRLHTPSGRIEIYSAELEDLNLADCGPHPTWYEPSEWLGADVAARFPLHLLSNQPDRRIHSQLDHGAASQSTKINGREPIRINRVDAAARNIAGGDIVRVFNDRGACLAGAVVTDAVMPGVVQLATGAWFSPVESSTATPLDAHGNPNVLTADIPASELSQAVSANTTLVEVEPFSDEPPPIGCFRPPVLRSE